MASNTDDSARPAEARTAGEGYWSQSRQPLASLVFIGPMLAIYELGVLFLGPGAPRNGADTWLRDQLRGLGFRDSFDYFLLPVLTVGILLGWHYVLRKPWRFSRSVLLGMAGESFLFASALWLSWKLYRFLLQTVIPWTGLVVAGRSGTGAPGVLGTLCSYFGAGIYEELLFRLILLNLVIGLLAWMRVEARASAVFGILLTSLLFSAAHYIGFKFDLATFLFRFYAGAFFALVYRHRGFGIAAGAHALYDVLVELLSRVF